MASIIVVSGPNEGDYYPLAGEKVVIGRDEECEIQIVDDLVSREHVSITCAGDDRYQASDLNSSNGSLINGSRITTDVPLADGDRIDIGSSRLMFSLREFPDRKSAWDYYKLAGEEGRSTLIT
jgi:pSer/pThr/pTyr-binding forkhead associated (FHA) protein